MPNHLVHEALKMAYLLVLQIGYNDPLRFLNSPTYCTLRLALSEIEDRSEEEVQTDYEEQAYARIHS